MRPTQRYLAILGDLVDSRAVADRTELQNRLRGSLRRFAEQPPVREALAAGPEITAGDEFQVLLNGDPVAAGPAAVHYLSRLTEDLRPVSVTFGLGLGALATELGPPVRELDGPCFHRAREALTQARKRSVWARVAGLPPDTEAAVNFVLRTIGQARAGWTDRQFEVIRTRRTLPLQKDVAERLSVNPSVVSEVLRAARHDEVLEGDRVVASLLNRALRPQESFHDE